MTKSFKLFLISALVLSSVVIFHETIMAQGAAIDQSSTNDQASPPDVTNNIAEPVVTTDENVILDETITAQDLGIAQPASGFSGFFQTLSQNIQYALTFDPVKKAELKLDNANKALLKAQQILKDNPDSEAAKAQYDAWMKKFEQRMTQVKARIQKFQDKAKDNPKVEQFLNKFTDKSFKQQRMMDYASGQLNDEEKAKLQAIRENSLKTFGEALNNLDQADKISERLEKITNQQKGSEFINLKSLEVLKNLETQVPAEAIMGIKNAQEKIMNRLNDALKAVGPNGRMKKFQEYSDESHSELPAKIKILEALQESPATPKDIKDSIPSLKNNRLKDLKEKVRSWQNNPDNALLIQKIEKMVPEVKSGTNFPSTSNVQKRPVQPAPSTDVKQ